MLGWTINNYGPATLSGNGIGLGDGAVFNNEAGASFDVQGDVDFRWDGNGAVATFNNLAGSAFVKSSGTGPAGSKIGLDFNNAGTVDLESGLLLLGYFYVTGNATSSGTFLGATGTTLGFLVSQDFTATSSIAGDTVDFGGQINYCVYNDAGTYSATSQTVVGSSATANFTGVVTGVGSSLDIYGESNFSPPAAHYFDDERMLDRRRFRRD